MGNFRVAKYSGSAGNLAIDDPNKLSGDDNIPLTAAQAAAVAPVVLAAGTAAATANTAAIQVALSMKGVVTLAGKGTFWVNNTLNIPSDTTLVIPPLLRLKTVAGTNLNMIRNANFNPADGSGWKPITSITTANGLLASVITPTAHGLTTGDIRLINGALPDNYNCVAEVTVTSATTFTYRLDLEPGGEFTSPATFRTATVTGTRTAGSKVITGVSSVNNLICGAFVTGTGMPAGQRIDTIDSATQITLMQNATSSGTGSLVCGFPLQHCPADRNIVITGGGTLDANCTNETGPDDINKYCINLRGIANTHVRDLNIEDFGITSVQYEGAYDSVIEDLQLLGCANYQSNGPHIDHCGRNNKIQKIFGRTRDDFVSNCQKQYNLYFDAGTPMGDIRSLTIRDIYPESCLSIIKCVPIAGLVFDDVKLFSVGGRSTNGTGLSVPIYDNITTGNHSTGTRRSIGRLTGLVIDGVAMDRNPQGTLWAPTADADVVQMSNIVMNGTNASGHLAQIASTSVIDGLQINNFAAATTLAPLYVQVSGNLKTLSLNNVNIKSAGGTFMALESGASDTDVQATNVRQDGCASHVIVNGGQTMKYVGANLSHLNYTSDWFGLATFCAIIGSISNSPDVPQAQFVTANGNNANGRFTWTGLGVDDLGSGATFAFSGQKHPNKKGTVTQNVTISTPTNLRSGTNMEGYIFTLNLVVSGSGTYTVTFPAEITHPAGFTQPGASANGKLTQLVYVYDGGNQTLRCISGVNTWV